jgi:hypothetical protein
VGCCIFAVAASFFPRLALLFLWIFTDYVTRTFDSFVWPLLGLIFLPFTTIMVCLVYSPVTGGIDGVDWLWVFLGLLLDMLSYGSGSYGRRARTAD